MCLCQHNIIERGAGDHAVEDRHHDESCHYQSDADYLRDRHAVELKGIVITEQLHKESQYAVKHEHQAEYTAGPGENFARAFGVCGISRAAPKRIKHNTQNGTACRFVQLRWMNRQ